MTRSPSDLTGYVDELGRLHTWPSKKNRAAAQKAVLEWFSEAFEPGREYSEVEVNAVLNLKHTFGDPALIRRELFERGLLNRTRDCRRYWRTETADPSEGLESAES